MPAAPIIGLIFVFKNRFINLANSTPPIVSKINAIRPIPIIRSVSTRTNASARILNEIVMPSSRVIRFASSFCAVWESAGSTPHSRIRFPNIRNPTSATDAGEISPTMIVTTIGNAILVVLDTFFGL